MNEPLLTNFNVPYSIRKRFDEVCRASGRTRTSVLVELMEDYTLSQGRALAARHEEFEKVDQVLEKSRRLMSFKEALVHQAREAGFDRQNRSDSDFALPPPMRSDEWEDW